MSNRHYLQNAQVAAFRCISTEMAGGATLPVIAGLAAGIGFVVAFSIFFTLSFSGGNSAPIEDAREVNFAVALERDMVVKKGETLRVPVTIETLGNLEIVLGLSIEPGSLDVEVPDAGGLALSLDRESIVLTRDNIAAGKARVGDNVAIGYGWLVTDAGFLTIAASPTADSGTYEYVVAARYAGHPGGTGIVSGQAITVTVAE